MLRNIIKVGSPGKPTLIVAGLAVALTAAGSGVAVAIGDSGPPIGAPGAVKVVYPVRTVGGPAADDGPNAPTAPGLTDQIPAGLISAGVPVPVSPEMLNPTNGWEVSDGAHLVAVYAGSAGNDPSVGRFVILRQEFPAGTQTIGVVDVPGSGAVSIVNPPTGVAAESSAAAAAGSSASGTQLDYTAADGSSGVLNLGNDTTSQG